MTDHCIHESDFGRMITMLDQHDKAINGNGQKGLKDTVTELNLTVRELKPVIEDLRIAVSGFGKFQREIETEVRTEEKIRAKYQVKKVNKQWLITTILVAVYFLIDKLFL